MTSLRVKLALYAGGLLTAAAGIGLTGVVNFAAPNGTSSGAILQLAGTTVKQIYQTDCTGTGGNVKVSNGAKYDTCIMPNPLSTSGAIQSISLMVSANPASAALDCGFVKARLGGSGSAVTNLNSIGASSGALAYFGTGTLRWNGADFLKCGTLTDPTSSFAAKLRVEFYDDTSE